MTAELASQRKCVERIQAEWPDFARRRAERLGHGAAVESVAENILEDLFTTVLDWPVGDVKFQQGFADVVLTCVHPKYKRPARCFAYVGNAAKPRTWKLPYLSTDGTVDAKRLPKAVAAVISNYRGGKVGAIPDTAIPDVLERLARAASAIGKMPFQNGETADIYV